MERSIVGCSTFIEARCELRGISELRTYAAACQECEHVESYVVRRGLTRQEGTTALVIACREYKQDVVECMLRTVSSKDLTMSAGSETVCTPLHVASVFGYADIVQMLVDRMEPEDLGEKANAVRRRS